MLKRREGPTPGSHRGRVPAAPLPPPPLPPVHLAQARRVGSGGKGIDQVVEDLIRAYARHAKPSRVQLAKLDMVEWRSRVRFLAAKLRQENISPDAFVGFVVATLAVRRQPAYAERVFITPDFSGEHPWLTTYRASGAGKASVKGYRASAERARVHDERAASAQVPKILTKFLLLWG